MKLAVLLSGRIKQYEQFLHLLQRTGNKYEIHVFISVNDIYSDFYEKVQKLFGNYLKGFHCNEYIVPENFTNKWFNIPATYSTLSCLYNDKYSFNMATKFADDNNFSYDVYLRFRSDIIATNFPDFHTYDIDSNIIFSVVPFCKFVLLITDNPDGEVKDGTYYRYGDIKHNGKKVTGDIAFGNRIAISTYCSCYDYVLKKNEENNGIYVIWFEFSTTTFLEDSDNEWRFFDYDYVYVDNRNEYQKHPDLSLFNF